MHSCILSKGMTSDVARTSNHDSVSQPLNATLLGREGALVPNSLAFIAYEKLTSWKHGQVRSPSRRQP